MAETLILNDEWEIELPAGEKARDWEFVPTGNTGPQQQTHLFPTSGAELWQDVQGVGNNFVKGGARLAGLGIDAAHWAGVKAMKALGDTPPPEVEQQASAFDTGQKMVDAINNLKPLGLIPIETTGPATEPVSTVGKVLGTASEYAPSAVIGGGSGALKDAILGGVAGGVARQAGAGPVGETLAAMSPGATGLLKAAIQGTGKAVASGAKSEANAYAMDAMGVKGADISKGFRKGITYIDEAGDVAPLSEASGVIGSLDKSWQTIKDDGFKLSNSANENLTRVNQRVAELASRVDNTIADAEKIARQSGVTSKFQPDIQPVQQYIDKLRNAGSNQAEGLQRELDRRMAAWNASPQELSTFKSFKQAIADDFNPYSGTKAAQDDVSQAFGRKLYRAFQVGLENGTDSIFAATNPGRVGEVSNLNHTISAYLNFKEPLTNAQGRGVLSKLGGGTLGSNMVRTAIGAGGVATGHPWLAAAALGVERLFPASMSSGLGKVANAAQAVSGPAKGAVRNAARAGAVGGIAAAINSPRSEDSETQNAAPATPVVIGGRRIPEQSAPQTAPQQRSPLLAAILAAENSGPTAVSPKGAKGVAQLMDATGRAYHKKLGIAEPYDPTNIGQSERIAQAYIDHLSKKYKDPRLVAAGYNMGETTLDGLLAKYGKSWEAIAPHLTGGLTETAKYVPRVSRALLGT